MLLELALALSAAISAPHSSVVVVHDGKVSMHHTGGLRDDSMLPIGSLSKVLAADVLLARAGGDLARIPAEFLLLATHRSGLPRNGELAKLRPDGKEHAPAYSNVGYELLGRMIENYPQELSRLVKAPIGMLDTTAIPTAGQCSRLAPGVDCLAAPLLASTASLYSTPADMAKYMLEALRRGPTAAHRAIVPRSKFANVKDFDHAGEAAALGLGWVLLEKPAKIVEKTGGYQGWFTYLAFSFDRRAAVFVAVPGEDLQAMYPVYAEVNRVLAGLATARREK